MMLQPSQIAFSESGSIVAIASEGEDIRIRCYDVVSFQLLFTLLENNSNNNNNSIAYESIAKIQFCLHDTLIVAQLKHSLVVWDVTRGVVSHTISMPETATKQEQMKLCDSIIIHTESSHSDGNEILVALVFCMESERYLLLEYDCGSGKLRRKIKVGSRSTDKESIRTMLCSLSISPCGSMYAVALGETIKLIHSVTGKRRGKYSLKNNSSFKENNNNYADDDMYRPLLAFSKENIYHSYGCDLTLISMNDDLDKKKQPILLHKSEDTIVSLFSLLCDTNDDNSSSSTILLLTCANGSAVLLHVSDGKVQTIIPISLATKEDHDDDYAQWIRKAIFHPSRPTTTLMLMQCYHKDRQPSKLTPCSCETLIYRNDDNSTFLLNNPHVISSTPKHAEDRPSKRVRMSHDHTEDIITTTIVEEDNDMTIAERLQQKEAEEELEDNDNVEDAAMMTPSSNQSQKSQSKVAFQSLSTVLTQALQSNDDTTLESIIFGTKYHPNLFQNSLTQLSDIHINVLTCKIVKHCILEPQRFNTHTSLNCWLHGIVARLYTSSSSSTDAMTNTEEEASVAARRALILLRSFMEKRTAHVTDLMDLKARLEIMGGEL